MLTYTDIKAACQRAYEAGTLVAQTADPAGINYGYMVYDSGVRRVCALGAALSNTQIGSLDPEWTLAYERDLVLDVVDIPSEDVADAATLQTAHDKWLKARRVDRTDPSRQYQRNQDVPHQEDAKSKFLEILYA